MYIRNFLTLLRRYTTSSVLNIVGMAVAFAAVYLIAVQVKFDLSYNRVIPNSEPLSPKLPVIPITGRCA